MEHTVVGDSTDAINFASPLTKQHYNIYTSSDTQASTSEAVGLPQVYDCYILS